MNDARFVPFKTNVDQVVLPERFTFPFFYQPHEIAVIAVKELQEVLPQFEEKWNHQFKDSSPAQNDGSGKMFGILVVKNKKGDLGYLAGFSGMIDGSYDHPPFVNAAFDSDFNLEQLSQGFKDFSEISEQIIALESSALYKQLQDHLKQELERSQFLLENQAKKHKRAKKRRRKERYTAKTKLSETAFQELLKAHHQEGLNEKFLMKEYEEYLEQKVNPLAKQVENFKDQILALKELRKKTSHQHQEWIFKHYNFLNNHGEVKNVVHLFDELEKGPPPSSTGDCAAPKLLQHAYRHGYQPIAMAEFWWGASSRSAVRNHQQYYPACRSKCEPLLTHMLKGLAVDPNPMLINPAKGKKLEIIYEDDDLIVVNKPADFLSVPGKNISDSVLTRLKELYPKATGPILVHRLDMATSGLLVATKNEESHKVVQAQFIDRTIQKKYIALLDGDVRQERGYIDLPLRVDLDNRPMQLVCEDYGKPAQTTYKVLERTTDGKTRIEFRPITGRTHQLRVHAAHSRGLNAPIVGDDLYGTPKNRLHLHAAHLQFKHPKTEKKLSFSAVHPF